MALSAGNTVTSADITSLKTHLISEMARRANGQDPYGQGAVNVAYQSNFTNAPAAGTYVGALQFRETAGYIADLFPVSWGTTITSGSYLGALQSVWDYLVGTLETDAATTTTPHCRSSCTGLCFGTCAASCVDSCTVAHGNCSNVLGGAYPCVR